MSKISAKQAKLLIKSGSGVLALLALVGAAFFLVPHLAQSRVGFVRECPSKDAGSWNWGEAPSGCEASRFGETSRIKFLYRDFVFDRTSSTPDEHRKDYVTSIHALIRDLSAEYIRAKNPDVHDDEVQPHHRRGLSLH